MSFALEWGEENALLEDGNFPFDGTLSPAFLEVGDVDSLGDVQAEAIGERLMMRDRVETDFLELRR